MTHPFGRLSVYWLAAALWFGSGCATPVAPTGGPPDTTPPFLVESEPSANTVNFESDRMLLTFSEKIDRASFQRAVSFTPDIVLPPELRWDGERVELVFRGPLEDSTTYILTLDKELKDDRGVALDRPITLAFSTGPEIDRGIIDGRVVAGASGLGVEGLEVFAFELTPATSFFARPAYRTQTDGQGAFTFRNLPPDTFLVAAVEDRNRNQLIDSTESVALPWWGGQQPDTSSTPVQSQPGRRNQPALVFHETDRQPPRIIQIQPLSSRRIRLRFSEPVQLVDRTPEDWVIRDTLSSSEFEVQQVYQHYNRQREIELVGDSLPDGRFAVDLPVSVTDTAGNSVSMETVVSFEPSASLDTVRLRFEGFGPTRSGADPGLNPSLLELGSGLSPQIRFNREPTADELARVTRVLADPDSSGRYSIPADTADFGRTLSFRTADGTSWVVAFEPELAQGDTVSVGVAGDDSLHAISLVYPGEGDTGAISGAILRDAEGSLPGTVVVHIRALDWPDADLRASADAAGVFGFERLLKGKYRLRAFVDRNGDGEWTPGTIEPLQLPEPVLWLAEPIDVRKGWESATDTLRFQRP